MTFSPKKFLRVAAVAACVSVSCGAVAEEAAGGAAAVDAAAKEELAFIDVLVQANMPDFAAPVIAAAKKRWPALGPKLKVLELRGALSLGKFDDVQKVVDSMTKKDGEYWALRLSMADAYYARSMMPECRKIYQEFFKAVPKPGPDLVEFYVESGFKWAQICVNEKNFDEAVKMYGELLAKLPNKGDTEERWCTVAMEDVSLIIRMIEKSQVDAAALDAKKDAKKIAELAKREKALFAEASKLVEGLLWKNELILVFGKAIAMKAHMELLRGELDKAQDLVNQYMPDLKRIHDNLLEQDPTGKEGFMRISPMPECRYLLAKVMWDGVQKEAGKAKPNEDMIKDSLFGAKQNGRRNGLGAYNHAINVFVKYPEATCAASAGELAEHIAKFVKTRYGKEIKTNISADQMEKVRRMQFLNADESFRNNDFANAVKAYGDILVQFPEVKESVGAVANLAESYLSLWQNARDAKEKELRRIETDAVEGYLAERFAGSKPAMARTAGDAVLRFAAKEHDAGQLARCQRLYDMYFANYPTHYNGAQTANSLAFQAYKAEDWDKAIHFYGIIAETFTNSTYYIPALQYLAICSGKAGNVEKQKEWLRLFAGKTPKIADRTTSHLQLALMQQEEGFAAFETASQTNDVKVAEEIRKQAYASVAGAIKDFRATSVAIEKELNTNKGLTKDELAKFTLRREQAMFLEGDSWQRLAWPEAKLSAFRAQAVKAYERYLAAYPKGKYSPTALVKIGTIYTAEKNMEESQKAFAKLQSDFPESNEAKNSVPRLASTLIEMGLRAEGVAQYKQMIASTGGKYTVGQFKLAGDALCGAKSWDEALEAYTKCAEMAKTLPNPTNVSYFAAQCLMGKARTYYGAGRFTEAHEALDAFIEKYSKSQQVIDAYEMLVETAAEEGRKEKDDDQRMRYFNAAVGAIKKLRGFRKTQAEQDVLDLRSGDVLVRKMEAEEGMGLKDKAKETCGLAVAKFIGFIQAHEPNEEHPAKDMTAAQLANLERCYSSALPLMARLGKEQNEAIIRYGTVYNELFPDGKHKTAVQTALAQAAADK